MLSPPKDFGDIGIVCPSVTLFCPDEYLGNGFSDFIVILQEYVLAYEDGSHQVWLHGTNWT